MVGLEELRGPRHTDGSDGRVLLHAEVFVGILLQFDQSDVVLVGGGVVAAQKHFSYKCLITWRSEVSESTKMVLLWMNDDLLHRNDIGGSLRGILSPQRELDLEGSRIRSGKDKDHKLKEYENQL